MGKLNSRGEVEISDENLPSVSTLFFFYKNIFYKNIKAEIRKTLRIFQE